MSAARVLCWVQWDKAGAIVRRRFRDGGLVEPSAPPAPSPPLPGERIVKRGLTPRPKQESLL